MARIGTWNLEDLFAVDDEYGPASPEEYEAKVAAIARIVRGLDADVLAVQEVGSTDALDDVVGRLGPPWRHALADPDGRGIRVGFLGRVELRDPEQVPFLAPELPDVVVDDEGTTTRRLSRPALRITAELDGVDVALVSLHFKSGRPGLPGGAGPADQDERARYAAYALTRRAAEAATTRVLANRLLQGDGARRPLVLLGDLNDTEHAATTRMLAGPADDEGWRLHNAAATIPARRRYSHRRGALLDHVLVSHALVDRLGRATTHDVGDASDHRPVTVDLVPRGLWGRVRSVLGRS